MNYLEWADEYFQNAERVHTVIEKKREEMNAAASAEVKKRLGDDIKEYRRIFRELMDIGNTLKDRVGGNGGEA